MKKIYTIVAVVSAVAVAAAVSVYAASDQIRDWSIGVIGGADGPTEVYISEGADYAALKRAVERLDELVGDMDDARTAERKAAIQAEIDALIQQHPELSEYDADYTTMTERELEAVEDRLDALEDAYERAIRNGGSSSAIDNGTVIGGADGPTSIYVAEADYAAIKTAVEWLEDLVDDMEDARTDERKAAIQAEIDALIEQYPELNEYDADYTTMTERELEAVEDRLDALEDAYERAIKGERAAASNNTAADGTNYAALKVAVERLDELVGDMEDARTAERKAAIQTEIDALIAQYPALSEYAVDYTGMTERELEAVEDRLDALEDEYERAARTNGNNSSSNNNGNSVPAENITPALPEGTDIVTYRAKLDQLEDLVDDMDDARSDEKKAAIQAEIDALIESCPALSSFAADYTTMTKQELEAIENELDILGDTYSSGRRRGILGRGRNGQNSDVQDQLRTLKENLANAQTDEERAEIIAQIKDLVSSGAVNSRIAEEAAAADETSATIPDYEIVLDFTEVPGDAQ